MNIYHSTRNQSYQNSRCLGYNNSEARQGYYIDATCELEAIAEMQEQFPDDIAGFTDTLWKTDCSVCLGLGQVMPRSLMGNGSPSTNTTR